MRPTTRQPLHWLRLLPYALGVCCVSGCASAPPVRLDQGQVQDPLRNLETYVLEDARKFKELVEKSGALYGDPAFDAYLNDLVRPFVPTVASSGYQFSFKVVRDPTLNAYTLGDGTIYFNTGLIARLKSAQQLAFVAGHEIAHVMNRDLVYYTDSLHKKTVGTKLTDLVVGPALSAFGLGGIGELGVGLAYAASVTGYGREREATADAESLSAMQAQQYDEREALRVFETFLREDERYHRGLEISFLSSHPSNEARMAAVKKAMGSKALDVFAAEPEDRAFLDATHDLRVDNASFNIQLGRSYHAVEDLQIILKKEPTDERAHYYLAEAYRLIAEDPRKLKDELSRKAWSEINDVADAEHTDYWHSRAAEEYRQAMKLDPAFPDPHRGLGLLQHARDERAQALASFQRYLELSPDAKDRRFVTSYITRLQEPPAVPASD